MICVLTGLDGFDISGWTFTLTVSSQHNPVDTQEQVYQDIASGADISDADKTATFAAPAGAVDPGSYHYDIQAENSLGQTKTVGKSSFVVEQDITK